MAIQRISPRSISSDTPRLIDALIYAMRSPFKSVTIQNETLVVRVAFGPVKLSLYLLFYGYI